MNKHIIYIIFKDYYFKTTYKSDSVLLLKTKICTLVLTIADMQNQNYIKFWFRIGFKTTKQYKENP